MTVKEQFIDNLKQMLIQRLGNNLSTRFETCSQAPAFGWSVDEYALMPNVANELRKEGYQVSSSVSFGVTDWTIINK
jgi:hypothetical protein